MPKPRYTHFSEIEEDLKKVYGDEFTILKEPENIKTHTNIFVRHNVCGSEFYIRIGRLIDKVTYCKKCSAYRVNYNKRLSQEEAEEEIKKVCKKANVSFKPFKYNKRVDTLIDFVCNTNKEHTFTLSYENAKKIIGCRYCNNKRHKTIEERQKEIDDKFGEGVIKICVEKGYENSYENTTFICDRGHTFERSFSNLMSKDVGCPDCYKENKRIENEKRDRKLLEEICFKQGYKIESFEYVDRKQIVKIICNKNNNHRWENSIKNIIANAGRCWYCSHNTSKAENELYCFIRDYLKDFNLQVKKQDRSLVESPNTTHKYEIDIFIPNLKIAFEYNGIYYHSDENISKRAYGYFKSADDYHRYKTDKCLDKGVELIHISEKDWLEDKDKVLEYVKNIIDERIKETI